MAFSTLAPAAPEPPPNIASRFTLSRGIHSLAQAKDGYLWIGTQNELLRFDGARFETFYEGQAEHLKRRSWS